MRTLAANRNRDMATHRNFKNALIAFVVPLPSILFYLYFLHHQNEDHSFWNWCNRHPLLLANVLFFLNVNVLFWFIALLQSSHWLIGLYWMVIPIMLLHLYANHSMANYSQWRSLVVILLTWIWSIRLIHSYFRRENWQLGVRQDWRFTDLSHQYGKKWWWVSFFAIYLSQQVFQMGLCLPLYVVHSEDKPWSIWDFIAIVICLSGITIAYHADTQLHKFISRNQKLKELGQPMVPILDKGLWCYSRHPNYFGEQLWWWGLALIAWNLGQGWTFIGALINSTCLAYVTVLVEKKMLSQTYRTEAYKLYQKTTSVLIPWFKSSSIGKDKKT